MKDQYDPNSWENRFLIACTIWGMGTLPMAIVWVIMYIIFWIVQHVRIGII